MKDRQLSCRSRHQCAFSQSRDHKRCKNTKTVPILQHVVPPLYHSPSPERLPTSPAHMFRSAMLNHDQTSIQTRPSPNAMYTVEMLPWDQENSRIQSLFECALIKSLRATFSPRQKSHQSCWIPKHRYPCPILRPCLHCQLLLSADSGSNSKTWNARSSAHCCRSHTRDPREGEMSYAC